MARPAGLEPATPGLEGRCSIQLSYGREWKCPIVTSPLVSKTAGHVARSYPVSMRCLTATIAVLVLAACSGEPPVAPAPASMAPVRVLMVTATAGFRHDSIPAARETMTTLGTATGDFVITPTEDLATLSAGNLSSYDVLFFALTSGELPLTDSQKSAMIAFISGGKGFIGTHSAADTLYDWPRVRVDRRRLLQRPSVDASRNSHRRRRLPSRGSRSRKSLQSDGRVLHISRQPASARPGAPATRGRLGRRRRGLPARLGARRRQRAGLLQRAGTFRRDVARLEIQRQIAAAIRWAAGR